MLGYDIDFGHLEFISLISSSKYQEKMVGYMCAGLLLGSNEELITLSLASIRSDLVSSMPVSVTLALSLISNMPTTTTLTADAFGADVMRVLDMTDDESRDRFFSEGDSSQEVFHSLYEDKLGSRSGKYTYNVMHCIYIFEIGKERKKCSYISMKN
jgi:hypothetical protein